MLVGRGKYLLMADADGATEIADLTKVLNKLKQIEKNGHGVVVGSRAHLQQDVVAKVFLYLF
jgi:dolichyl-phosphate beta-glucosyltransferase